MCRHTRGGRPLHCFGNTVRRKFKKNFSSVLGPRSGVSVCARQSPYGRSKCVCYTAWDRNARNVPHPLSGLSGFRPNIAFPYALGNLRMVDRSAYVIRHGIGMRGMCHTHFPDLADFGRILPNAVDRGYAWRINFGDS
jgi:hypothetical protein